ncbi:hypothetical protein Tdes44962_MAKER04520 [Teratosphaeria destructans]|uniref:Uncharacterized protein n=1 Tax=Teratosphaeria destructans TaxID=418781 RepID=A0A9W7SMQ6_9PEZI|nr:hypothetical protein Tdes44962_MAKER04520 [Teratosphaeria destructans]
MRLRGPEAFVATETARSDREDARRTDRRFQPWLRNGPAVDERFDAVLYLDPEREYELELRELFLLRFDGPALLLLLPPRRLERDPGAILSSRCIPWSVAAKYDIVVGA